MISRGSPTRDLGGLPQARARRLSLYTQREAVVIMRRDSVVCRAEGLLPRSQVLLRHDGKEVTATLFQWDAPWLGVEDAGLSEAAWSMLGVDEGELVSVSHAPSLSSLGMVRQRIFGDPLDLAAMEAIVADVVAGRYTDAHLAAFLTSSSSPPLSDAEVIALTRAMIDAGERLTWNAETVADKHSVGGLPGNRTTPIVVAIAAACGLLIPKTSSRAITSPAGTADAMATITTVDLDMATLRRVVEAEGGCLAWGGGMHLSPADEIFIGVERQLDIDTEGQLIASVLSKKIAAGSNHVLLDVPVGPTAKVRSPGTAAALIRRLDLVARHFGLRTRCEQTDGSHPVGGVIGPALEMRAVLSILRLEEGAPADLRDRSLHLAGALLELADGAPAGRGRATAQDCLNSGRALEKFERICRAQGGFREPAIAPIRHVLKAPVAGTVTAMDNRRLARLAKMAGAPDAPSAGLQLHVTVGSMMEAGQPLLTVHAESEGALAYALALERRNGSGIILTGS